MDVRCAIETVFDEAEHIASVSRVHVAVIAAFLALALAVAARVRRLANRRFFVEVANITVALRVSGAHLAVLEQACIATTIAGRGSAVVAPFGIFEAAVSAGIGGLANRQWLGHVANTAVTVGIVGAGLPIFEEAGGATAIAWRRVAIVAHLPFLDPTIATRLGWLAEARHLAHVAEIARALLVTHAPLTIFPETRIITAVAGTGVAVIARLAWLAYAIAARVRGLTLTAVQLVADSTAALVICATRLAELPQAVLVAAVAGVDVAVFARFARVENAVPALANGHTTSGEHRIAGATLALVIRATCLAVFIQALRAATVRSDGIAVVANLIRFDPAVPAAIRWLANVGILRCVANQARAFSVIATGLPDFLSANRIAAVATTGVPVVARFEPLEFAVAARIDRLTPVGVLGSVADGARAFVVAATGLTGLLEAIGIAAVTRLSSAIVTSLAGLQDAVTTYAGRDTRVAHERVASFTFALLVQIAHFAHLAKTVRIASVTITGVPVLASLALFEHPVPANASLLTDVAVQAVAHARGAVGIGQTRKALTARCA